MKTAILYAGQLRTWEQVKENQYKTLGSDADRFFFTTEEPQNTPHKQFVKDHTGSYYSYPMTEYDGNRNPITQLHGSLNQWHSMFVGFAIAPTSYDVYIKSRPDIEVSAPIDFSDYDYADDIVYIPSGNDHCDGVNDQIAFGNYAVMKKYFSVYLNHGKLFAQGKVFHTEYYLAENLKMLGVNIVRIPQGSNIVRLGQPLIYTV